MDSIWFFCRDLLISCNHMLVLRPIQMKVSFVYFFFSRRWDYFVRFLVVLRSFRRKCVKVAFLATRRCECVCVHPSHSYTSTFKGVYGHCLYVCVCVSVYVWKRGTIVTWVQFQQCLFFSFLQFFCCLVFRWLFFLHWFRPGFLHSWKHLENSFLYIARYSYKLWCAWCVGPDLKILLPWWQQSDTDHNVTSWAADISVLESFGILE